MRSGPWSRSSWRTPLVGVTASDGRTLSNAGDAPLTNAQRRQLPSYVSARSFARALIDILVPNANGKTTMGEVRAVITIMGLPDHLKNALLSIATETTTNIATF